MFPGDGGGGGDGGPRLLRRAVFTGNNNETACPAVRHARLKRALAFWTDRDHIKLIGR